MLRRSVACFICVLFTATNVLAFGKPGHAMIGAIADKKLAGTATGTKLSTLLNGVPLEKAAVIPDDLKSHDGHPNTYKLAGQTELTKQLRAFLIANPKGAAMFDHHAYHYVDIPVEGTSEYGSGTEGRSDVDVVKMVKFCVRVLKGTEPEDNPRKITKAVAVILLAHYVGDMHQPLHIGAEFFNDAGQPVNPDVTGMPANGDKGGNGLTLHLRDASGNLQIAGSLHSYWDDKAFKGALNILHGEIMTAGDTDGVTNADVANFLATQTPVNWAAITTPVEDLSLLWANEMMPTARNAHQRLEYSSMLINTTKHTAAGQAIEKPVAAGADSYSTFAAKTTRDNVHRAGWRLAALLEQLLQ